MPNQNLSQKTNDIPEAELQGKWKKCLQHIQNEIPLQTFQTWFLPIIPVTLIDQRLILRIPSRFVFEWIESHYGELLKNVVKSQLGKSVDIEYLIAPSPKQKAEPDAEDVREEKLIPESPADGGIPDEEEEIDPSLLFDNFFSGKENRLAKKAANYVAKNTGSPNYNPLIIYGESGTGKSHLLHAVANDIQKGNPRKKIILMNSEHFLHEYIYNLQQGDINKFKRKLTRSDVFLLDDVQFLSNKQKSQEILLYIVRELVKKKKQVVVTSDIQPSRLTQFNPYLISFFQRGLIVDLISPEYETREKIILYHLQKNEIQLEEEIVKFIVEDLNTNTHLLNAAITRIIAQISLLGKPLTLNDAQFIVAQIYPQWQGLNGTFGNQTGLKSETIINAVCRFFNIPNDIVVGTSRKKEVVLARQIAIYLLRELTGDSLASIGYLFGNRHHASILYSFRKIEAELKNSPILQNSIKQIKDQIMK